MKKLALLTSAALALLGNISADSCCKQDCFAYPKQALFDRCQDRIDGDFFLYGDWLFWNVRRCGLDFVLPDTNLSEPVEGHFVDVHPEYKSGYRLGAGFRSCGGGDFTFRWTHFSPHYHADYIGSTPNGLPTRVDPRLVPFQLAQQAFSFYHLKYNEFDFEIGSWTEVDCATRYRLFVGAKLAYIDEDLDTVYLNSLVTSQASFYWEVQERIDAKAFGFTTGVEFERDIACGFGFFARGAVGLLVGDYKVAHNEYNNVVVAEAQTIEPIFNPLNLVESIHDHHRCLLTNVELAVGFDYLLLDRCDFTLRLGAGYEFHGWYNTQDFINLIGQFRVGDHERNNSSFGLDGLFVRLEAAY